MSDDHDLTEAPIPKLIRKISFPVMTGFFFNTMYNVVDTYFGGQISTEALAALSLSFPVFFLIIVFGQGISTGVTAVIANALGAKDMERVKKFVGQSIFLGLVIGVILTVVGPLSAPSLFQLLGASGEYLKLSLDYMYIIFFASICFMMISVLSALLQSVGNTIAYRNFLIGGFFLNVIFDPWFLYGGLGVPAMGFKGVATSTVLIQLIGVVYLYLYAKKRKIIEGNVWHEMKPDLVYIKEILKQAGPASLNMVTVGAGIFVITYFINQFGQDAVAAYGIATRVEQIILLPTIGITVAALAIIGQNNGAGRFDRVKETLNKCLKYATIVMAVGGALIFALSRPIMDFFTDDVNVIDIGAHYLKIAAPLAIAYALLFTTVSALQGMKKPMFAVWIGIFRQVVAPIVVFNILIIYFGLGIDGVWWGVFSVNTISAIISLFYAKHVLSIHGRESRI